MLKLNHKKLKVWDTSRALTKLIYSLTKKFPREELYGLTNQLRRASVSVISNLSEGCARNSKLERKRFFEIARSSLVEIDTQLEVCKDLEYINDEDLAEVDKELNNTFALLSSMISNQ